MKAYLINMHLLVPRSSAKVKVKYKGYISQKMAVSGAFVFFILVFQTCNHFGFILVIFCLLQFLNLQLDTPYVLQLKSLASKVLFALSLNALNAVFGRISAR